MTRALIGHTGFIGQNLARALPFDDHFNSTNIESIAGRRYDEVWCAGLPAAKWIANREPEKDRENLERLERALESVQASHFVLISTIDVYPRPIEVDEDTPIDVTGHHAYGRHRLEFEEFVRGRWPATIVRLPGMFGRGLKKNAIYDLLHDNNVAAISPEGVFQFYDVDWLVEDVNDARRLGRTLVNLATEPVSMREVAQRVFHTTLAGSGAAARYDFRSKYAPSGYFRGKEAVLAAMTAFVRSSRG